MDGKTTSVTFVEFWLESLVTDTHSVNACATMRFAIVRAARISGEWRVGGSYKYYSRVELATVAEGLELSRVS